jgi:predicted nucleotidyltransferase
MSNHALRERYDTAVARLIEQARSDATLIGLYVYGSAQRGDVWEHSDIDVVFVTSDEKRPWQAFSLVEDGIQVSAEVCSRSHFRKIHERTLRGSTIHAIFSSGKLVYAEEPTLEDYLDEAAEVGERDLALLRLLNAINLGGTLHGAAKALVVRHDITTGYRWTIHALEDYARLILLQHGETLCSELVSRACVLSEEYAEIWNRALKSHSDTKALLAIRDELEGYLRSNANALYKPLLDYLQEEHVLRTATEIQRAVGARIGMPDVAHGVGMACESLAEMGLIERATMPVRLTRKGQVEFEELAYYYGGET